MCIWYRSIFYYAEGVRALLAVPRNGNPGDRPITGITGDLYTRINPVGNMGLLHYLENMGCEVWPSPYFAAGVDMTTWKNSRRDLQRRHLKGAFWDTANKNICCI